MRKMERVLTITVAGFLLFAQLVFGQVLLSDNFSGTSINPSKWKVVDDGGGGSVTQNSKLYWNKAGSGRYTGHGIQTVQSFDDGYVYIIQGDYEVDRLDKAEGEGGTGITILPESPSRGSNVYSYARNAIVISFGGGIYYTGNGSIPQTKLTTKSVITPAAKASGCHNDIFYYLNDKTLHLKIELDTKNRTIKCWANHSSSTYYEASFSSTIWNQMIGSSKKFKIEEYRTWAGTTDYVQHRLDNWSISKQSTGHHSLELTSGRLNGSEISTSIPQVTVDAGEHISGSLNFTADNYYENSSAIMPFAWTPTWGSHQSSYHTITSWVPHGRSSHYSVDISLSAPAIPGTYYLWFVMAPRYSVADMMACDRPPVWNDRDDIADMGSSQYESIRQDGSVNWTHNNGQLTMKAIRAVKIYVRQTSHQVSTPRTPSGPSTADINESVRFSTSGAECSRGHAVEYRFDWGDGSYSSWVGSNATHRYSQSGSFRIRAQARCQSDHSVVSSWSSSRTITIESGHIEQGANMVCSPNTVYPGGSLDLEIRIGSQSEPVQQLKIISFELSYEQGALQYQQSEKGDYLTSAQSTVVPDEQNGLISASIYRTSGGETGYGTVIVLRFMAKASVRQGQILTFRIQNVMANDSNGNAIAFQFSPVTVTVQTGLEVWPGDANNDGKVTIFDINSIVAMYWNKTGPARESASMDWQGQLCQPWSPEAATYADCNGNGKIDIFDINAVVVNFGRTHQHGSIQEHGLQKSLPGIASGCPVHLQALDYDETTNEFWVDVIVGDGVNAIQNLKIISFELQIQGTEQFDFLGYFPGDFMSAANQTVIYDSETKKISASIYHTTNTESGYGTILRLKFKAEKNHQMSFAFDQILANNGDGDAIDVAYESYSITTNVRSEYTPAAFALYQNYPNPFNPHTQISFELPRDEHVLLQIFNSRGERVKQMIDRTLASGQHTITWDGTDQAGQAVASGFYIYRLIAGEQVSQKSMLLLH